MRPCAHAFLQCACMPTRGTVLSRRCCPAPHRWRRGRGGRVRVHRLRRGLLAAGVSAVRRRWPRRSTSGSPIALAAASKPAAAARGASRDAPSSCPRETSALAAPRGGPSSDSSWRSVPAARGAGRGWRRRLISPSTRLALFALFATCISRASGPAAPAQVPRCRRATPRGIMPAGPEWTSSLPPARTTRRVLPGAMPIGRLASAGSSRFTF
jgi:hypothetical protein